MIIVILVVVLGVATPSFVISSNHDDQYSYSSQPQYPPNHQNRPVWSDSVPLYAQSSFYYADYKAVASPKKFLPPQPNCPHTGRTVCEDIEQYPVDRVLDVVKAAKARKFNFSSIFADERENDSEPKFEPPKPTYHQVQGKGYVVYQTALPVLPIRYVSQQNSQGQRRQPTHQIVFPSQQKSSRGEYPQQQQQYASSSSPIVPPPPPPPPPTSDYQQQQTPTSVSSYGNYNAQQPQQSQHLNSAQTNMGQSRYMPPPPPPPPPTSSPTPDQNYQYGSYPPLSYKSYRSSSGDPYNLPPPASPTSWRPVYPDSTTSGNYMRQEKINFRRHKRQASSDEDDNEVEAICRTQKQFISPKVALNDRSEWKYIVNLGDRDPRLRQIIKVDVCSNANEPCSNQISLPFGFTSRCKQKYIKKKLLSLDPDGQGTSAENFFVPSCCVCEIVRSNDTARRRRRK